jgi:SAM-dependent methyltransferase
MAQDDDNIVIWHHGLIARWWANFNVDGPEIEFFRPIVAAGQPALDVACGTGRLLVPWVADGLDVDGVDASPDMIAACRERARRVGREPGLHVQPVHRLDLPRRYGAVVMCGGFGLGGSRDQDREGLRRMFAHLRPGGMLALDNEVEQVDTPWRAVSRPRGVETEPPGPEERRLGDDGFEYALQHRVVTVDPAARTTVRELQAWQWRDGDLTAHEVRHIDINVWTTAEIAGLLAEVGFADVQVVGGYHGGAPTGEEEFLVLLARRPEV